MTHVEPFRSHVLVADSASLVVGPGFDALTDAQRIAHAQSHPLSFLGVLAPGEGGSEASAERLARLIDGGHFVERGPAFYLYRLSIGEHRQTAIIADLHVDDFVQGRVRVHETTRTEKENELLEFTRKLRINSSPVCLTYRSRPAVDDQVDELLDRAAKLDFSTTDGVRHQVWEIAEPEAIERLSVALEEIEACYVTDGHHRAATAVRLADLVGTEDSKRVLVALFPHDQMRILPFHRIVSNAGPTSAALERLEDQFVVTELGPNGAKAAEPEKAGRFALWIEESWYRLRPRIDPDPSSPVEALDAVRVQAAILEPVFGINDPRLDQRLDYAPGRDSLDHLAELAREVNGAAIALHAVAIEQILDIADAGLTMPPKSTWFDPKVRSGIWIRHR